MWFAFRLSSLARIIGVFLVLCCFSKNVFSRDWDECPEYQPSVYTINDCEGNLKSLPVNYLFSLWGAKTDGADPGYPETTPGAWSTIVSKVVDNWSGNPCCCDKNENCSPLADKTDSYTKSEETGFTGTVSVTASLSTSEKASIGVEMVGEVGGSVTEDISAEGSGSWDTKVTETNTATIGPVHSCQVGGAKLEVRDVHSQTQHSLYQDETGYYGVLAPDCYDIGQSYQMPIYSCYNYPKQVGSSGNAENDYKEYRDSVPDLPVHACPTN